MQWRKSNGPVYVIQCSAGADPVVWYDVGLDATTDHDQAKRKLKIYRDMETRFPTLSPIKRTYRLILRETTVTEMVCTDD